MPEKKSETPRVDSETGEVKPNLDAFDIVEESRDLVTHYPKPEAPTEIPTRLAKREAD